MAPFYLAVLVGNKDCRSSDISIEAPVDVTESKSIDYGELRVRQKVKFKSLFLGESTIVFDAVRADDNDLGVSFLEFRFDRLQTLQF